MIYDLIDHFQIDLFKRPKRLCSPTRKPPPKAVLTLPLSTEQKLYWLGFGFPTVRFEMAPVICSSGRTHLIPPVPARTAEGLELAFGLPTKGRLLPFPAQPFFGQTHFLGKANGLPEKAKPQADQPDYGCREQDHQIASSRLSVIVAEHHILS
jgi:hypothetical protein